MCWSFYTNKKGTSSPNRVRVNLGTSWPGTYYPYPLYQLITFVLKTLFTVGKWITSNVTHSMICFCKFYLPSNLQNENRDSSESEEQNKSHGCDVTRSYTKPKILSKMVMKIPFIFLCSLNLSVKMSLIL